MKGVAEGTISWTEDPDFGYLIAEDVPEFDDPELLQPRKLYEREGRLDEYDGFVEKFKAERKEHLAKFPELSGEIVNAVS